MTTERYGFDDDTVAILVAGRALSHEVTGYTIAMVEQLQELAARREGTVVVPGTDLRPTGDEWGTGAPAYCRLAIGIPVVVARSDDGAPAPARSFEELREAVARARRTLDPFFWRRVAAVLEPAKGRFSPASVRSAARETGHATLFDGMSLDGAELIAAEDALYLTAAGPLPMGDLWYGRRYQPSRPYLDPDGDEEWDKIRGGLHSDRICYGAGQGPGQDPHEVWTEGVHVARCSYDALDVVPVSLDPEQHRARVEVAGHLDGAGYLLCARYD